MHDENRSPEIEIANHPDLYLICILNFPPPKCKALSLSGKKKEKKKSYSLFWIYILIKYISSEPCIPSCFHLSSCSKCEFLLEKNEAPVILVGFFGVWPYCF